MISRNMINKMPPSSTINPYQLYFPSNIPEKDAKVAEAETARRKAMEAQLSGESSGGRKKRGKK